MEIDLIQESTYYFAVDGVNGDWGRVQLGLQIARVQATMSITRPSTDTVQITLMPTKTALLQSKAQAISPTGSRS